jgi:hypothetical protein
MRAKAVCRRGGRLACQQARALLLPLHVRGSSVRCDAGALVRYSVNTSAPRPGLLLLWIPRRNSTSARKHGLSLSRCVSACVLRRRAVVVGFVLPVAAGDNDVLRRQQLHARWRVVREKRACTRGCLTHSAPLACQMLRETTALNPTVRFREAEAVLEKDVRFKVCCVLCIVYCVCVRVCACVCVLTLRACARA